jgi:hypothetical protein
MVATWQRLCLERLIYLERVMDNLNVVCRKGKCGSLLEKSALSTLIVLGIIEKVFFHKIF